MNPISGLKPPSRPPTSWERVGLTLAGMALGHLGVWMLKKAQEPETAEKPWIAAYDRGGEIRKQPKERQVDYGRKYGRSRPGLN